MTVLFLNQKTQLQQKNFSWDYFYCALILPPHTWPDVYKTAHSMQTADHTHKCTADQCGVLDKYGCEDSSSFGSQCIFCCSRSKSQISEMRRKNDYKLQIIENKAFQINSKKQFRMTNMKNKFNQ